MEIEDALHQYFGFREFRPGQDKIVSSILGGQDTLVIMPTGGGKSLCYQLPALLSEGVTVVISPLIALMKDQVDALKEKNIPAAYINSSVGAGEQRELIEEMRSGRLKLVYIAPERFRHRHFVESLRQTRIAFIAVDEAHCVSMWGHDFRPDYLRVGEAVERLGRPTIAAFTATATPEVREDIAKSLRLQNPQEFVRGFERPNLAFNVTYTQRDEDKYSRLRRLIEAYKTGIVYCATRKQVEKVSLELREWEVPHIAYHGGMSEQERHASQNYFISKEVNIAVATNAFGMGIDRSDIRFVAHFELSGSVEAYYQEAGRAGRDGLPGVCELFYRPSDKHVQEFFLEGTNPDVSTIRNVYATLRSHVDCKFEVTLSIDDLTTRVGHRTNPMAVGTVLSLLQKEKYIERFDIPGQRIRGTRLLRPEIQAHELQLDLEALEIKRDRDNGKLDAVLNYCNTHMCRQEAILRYFGEKNVSQCGRCDRCLSGELEEMREPDAEELVILQKALSGVARMSERNAIEGWVGKYGRNRIIDMLVGSQAKEIVEHGLDKLSTHGLLKDMGKGYLLELFREMERIGLICKTGGKYPLVTLTPLGNAVMRAKETVRMIWPKPPEQNAVSLSGDFDHELFSKLKHKRMELSARNPHLKPYMIFPDSTLEELATYKPINIAEGKTIKGIGKYKARKWLPDFIPVIARHTG